MSAQNVPAIELSNAIEDRSAHPPTRGVSSYALQVSKREELLQVMLELVLAQTMCVEHGVPTLLNAGTKVNRIS
jgi:hypothetical protein